MKKLIVSMALLGTVAINNVQAKNLSGKTNTSNESNVFIEDEWGISGTYILSSPWDYYREKIKQMTVEFVKEENGAIVNKFTLSFGKNNNNKEIFIFDEKAFNKQGIKNFKGHLVGKAFDIMQLDKDVLFLNCTDQKGYIVLAKTADLLKTWDEETGLAKYEADKKKLDVAAAAGLRKKLEDFKAYKENVGKVIFTRAQGAFKNLKDDASENPANFQTEWVTGNGLAWKAYFDKAFNEVCAECDNGYNVVFEMGKHKIDLMQLRSSSSAFSKLFIPKINMGSQYMTFTWLWDDYDYNRAMVMALHKNIEDGNLKDAGKQNLKVTIYTYKDKTNGEKIAEGNISVKYNATGANWVARYSKFKEAIE